MPETKVVIGGQTDGSLDSAVDRAKAKVRELGEETKRAGLESAHWADEQVKHHLMVEAVTHGVLHVVKHLWSETAEGIESSMGSALGRILPKAASAVGGLALLTGSVKILSGAMALLEKASGAAQKGVTNWASLENVETKLKTITGSREAARVKTGELAKTFQGTGVSVPDAADAFKTAHMLTGGVLSDKKGLTMLGDTAAASGNGIKDTAGAVGKLYADLQAGRPIKDAADRLQEMGVISNEVRSSMETMLYEGKGGGEVWSMLTNEFKKSSGAMAEARDNLTSLQAAVAQAKTNLYTTFAESSVPGEKKNLYDKAALLERLQPAAQEAGDLFGQLGGSADGTATALNSVYKVILDHAGDLKTWVDAWWLGKAALVGLALAAAPVGAGLIAAAFGLGTVALATSAAVIGIGAVLGIGAGTLMMWTAHTNRATEAQLALMKGTDDLVGGMKKDGDAIKSVADKALALAKAYDDLKAAKEALRHAKTPEEHDELESRVRKMQLQVRWDEDKDESKLTPSAEREKKEKDRKDAQDKLEDTKNDFRAKLQSAEETLEWARKQQYDAREKLNDPALGPGYSPSAEELHAQMKRLEEQIAASKHREAELRKESSGPFGVDRIEPLLKQADQEVAHRKKLHADLDQTTAQLSGAPVDREARRTKLVDADTAVAKAESDVITHRKNAEEQENHLAELAAESKIAALETEGLARARDEWAIKREMYSAQLAAAQASGNEVRGAEAQANIDKGDSAIRKQTRDLGDQQAALAVEMQIAELNERGLARAMEEWKLKRALLETELARRGTTQDEEKAAEARLHITQGDAALQEQVRAAADQHADLDTEMQIAALQGDGVERLQKESELRLALIEARWKELEPSKDALEIDKQRLAYYEEQLRAAKALEGAAQRAADVHAEYGNSVSDTDQNRRKKKAEQDLAQGKITQQQKRDIDAQIARENEERARKEAQDLTLRSQAAYDKGNSEEGEKLAGQAERKVKDADNFGFDAESLARVTDKPRAIGDSLAKIGLGGNVAPAGLSGITASNERIARNSEEMKVLLQKILEKPANNNEARFSR